ncbi:hypothetical protein BDZ97DRAFT_1760564 [Flammula alnicola]|nr:hypothetical protein BDZ97DRAFT_1760564 [Flammula alnicola]
MHTRTEEHRLNVSSRDVDNNDTNPEPRLIGRIIGTPQIDRHIPHRLFCVARHCPIWSIRKTPEEPSTTPGVADLCCQPPPTIRHACNARTKAPRSGSKAGDTRHGGETLEAGDPQAYEEMCNSETEVTNRGLGASGMGFSRQSDKETTALGLIKRRRAVVIPYLPSLRMGTGGLSGTHGSICAAA